MKLLILYSIITFTVTHFVSKKYKNDSFFVADRQVGTLLGALAVAVSWIWAPSLFVSSEQAFRNGWIGLFWFTVPNALTLWLFIPFAKRIRKELPNGYTLTEYMTMKYGEQVGKVYKFSLSLLSFLSTGVQIMAGASVITMISNIPLFYVTVVISLIALSYSITKGFRNMITASMLQGIIIIVGAIVISSMLGREFTPYFDPVGLTSPMGKEVFLSFGLSTSIGLIAGTFGDQSFWQKAFAYDEKTLGKSFFLGGLFFAIVPISLGAVGLMARGVRFVPTDVSRVGLEFMQLHLPNSLVMVFVTMVLSGLLSTIEGNLNSISVLFSEGKSVKHGRVGMVTLLIVSIAMANIPNIKVLHMFMIYGTLRSATLLPTVMTILGKQLNPKGVQYGIMLSLGLGLPMSVYGNLGGHVTFIVLGSLTTLLTSGVVSLLYKGE